MYKRKGCAVWTVEEKDCKIITITIESRMVGLKNGSRKREDKKYFVIKDLWFHKDTELPKQIDVIFEYKDKRYLGYLEFDESRIINAYRDSGFYIIPECKFIICQENYLDGVEIVREIEYVVE